MRTSFGANSWDFEVGFDDCGGENDGDGLGIFGKLFVFGVDTGDVWGVP